MKRFWFGVLCLLVFLALGTGATWLVDRSLESVQLPLGEVLAAAAQGRWDTLAPLLDSVDRVWQGSWPLLGTLVAHEPLEEADQLLQQARLYLAQGENVPLLSTLTQLKTLLTALADAQKPLFWNLF